MHPPTIVLTLALLVPSLGCDLEDSVDFDRDAVAQTSADAAGHADRPHAPPHELLLRSAVEVGGLDEQPEMLAALDELQDARDAMRSAHDALRSGLADAVAARSVDAGAFDRSIAAIETAARVEAEALQRALDTAHALLDAEQRAEVVDMLPPPPQGPPAAGDRPPPPGGEGSRSRGPGPGHGPEALLQALQLDDAQRQALRQALGEPSAPEQPTPPDLAAFADEGFEAAALGLAAHHPQRSRERAEHEVTLLAALVPLLDETQLATLEQWLSQPPPGPMREQPV